MIAEHVNKMIQGFIIRIRRGNMTDALVLADWLEEVEHPKADEIRRICGSCIRFVDRMLKGEERPRRGWSVADECGVSLCGLQAAVIHTLCGGKLRTRWPYSEIRKMWDKNRVLTPLPGITGGDDDGDTEADDDSTEGKGDER